MTGASRRRAWRRFLALSAPAPLGRRRPAPAGVPRVRLAVPLRLALLALLAISPLLSRPAGANSRYSLRGNGEAIQSSRSDVRALGGAETGSRSPSVSGNPASLAYADRTMFYGTYETQWVRTEETPDGASALVRKDYEGLVPNLSLVYPLPGDVRFGTGILVERRRGGRIQIGAETPSGQEYLQIYDAKGNVLVFPALFAKRFGSVAVGGGLDVVLLNSEIRWRNDFPEATEFQDTDDLDTRSLWGVAWKIGARVPIGDRVAIGAWYSLPSNLDGSRRLENADALDSTDDLKIDRSEEVADRFSVGLEARILPKLRVLGDWVHESWESVKPFSPLDTFRDVDRFLVGLEYVPPQGRSGLRVPLRAGFRTENLHFLDGLGREVRESVITAGSGFGFSGGRGVIDWFVEYGWRGEAGVTEYREKLVRVGVTLTGLEEWTSPLNPQDEEDW